MSEEVLPNGIRNVILNKLVNKTPIGERSNLKDEYGKDPLKKVEKDINSSLKSNKELKTFDELLQETLTKRTQQEITKNTEKDNLRETIINKVKSKLDIMKDWRF